jgi:hypothetical protein
MNATVRIGGPCRFPLGQTVMTRGVQRLVAAGAVNPIALLRRHQAGDWGNLDQSDARANDQALKLGNRILSAYPTADPVETQVWVITEADRSSTCILLPSEY